jgi:hypothetical protein
MRVKGDDASQYRQYIRLVMSEASIGRCCCALAFFATDFRGGALAPLEQNAFSALA